MINAAQLPGDHKKEQSTETYSSTAFFSFFLFSLLNPRFIRTSTSTRKSWYNMHLMYGLKTLITKETSTPRSNNITIHCILPPNRDPTKEINNLRSQPRPSSIRKHSYPNWKIYPIKFYKYKGSQTYSSGML